MLWWQVVISVGLGFNLGALTVQLIHGQRDHAEIMRQIRAIGNRHG